MDRPPESTFRIRSRAARPRRAPVSLRALLVLLLTWVANGCGEPAPPGDGLSDHQLADLVWEAIQLQERYAGRPDSLAAERDRLFERFGVTRDDLEREIDLKESWEAVLGNLDERLRAEKEKKKRGSAVDTLRH